MLFSQTSSSSTSPGYCLLTNSWDWQGKVFVQFGVYNPTLARTNKYVQFGHERQMAHRRC
jgi:hypothetical protein